MVHHLAVEDSQEEDLVQVGNYKLINYMKIFGKDLFKKQSGDLLFANSINILKDVNTLPDFYKNFNNRFEDYMVLTTDTSSTTTSYTGSASDVRVIRATSNIVPAQPEVKGKKKDKKQLTPKDIYKLNVLNDNSFVLKVDKDYVDAQLQSFKDKLSILAKTDKDMRNGVNEISSIIIRLENRKKYPKYNTFYEEFPYTTTQRMAQLLKDHDHLKLDTIEQFVADLPKEAIDTMKQYQKTTQKLCEKDPVFYLIANKKDFEKSDKRRDPILFAQSPFGHFWQILGAWDEEMLLLEDL